MASMWIVPQLLACLASCYVSSVATERPLIPAAPRLRPAAASSSSQSLLFAFGASLLDAGENSVAMPRRSGADFEPYGCDYFGKPAGRWSNGRTFMDFISEGVGYGHIPPYLQAVGADYSRGVNFASSGSTAANSSLVGSSSGGLFSLLVQVDQFQDFQDAVLPQSNGELRSLNRRNFSNAIYIFEAGSNDYYRMGMGRSSDQLINATVSAAIAAMKTAFQKLYEAGARTFLVMNLPPLGCYPAGLNAITGSEELDENNCNAKWMSVVHMHNDHLNELLGELQEDYPSGEWVLFDAYSLFLEAYEDPSKFGVKYPYRACCGAGGAYNVNSSVACGGEAKYINGTLVKWTRCEDPSLYMMWDALHPVESFAYHVAQGVLNATHVVPASFNILSRTQPSQQFAF